MGYGLRPSEKWHSQRREALQHVPERVAAKERKIGENEARFMHGNFRHLCFGLRCNAAATGNTPAGDVLAAGHQQMRVLLNLKYLTQPQMGSARRYQTIPKTISQQQRSHNLRGLEEMTDMRVIRRSSN